ncbi:MAG: hypothetical protein V4850_27520 [Myxococcota bacterium]
MSARPWIIDATQDRVFLFGGVAASAALTLAILVSGELAPWWWVWVIALDGPHLFATLARTYLDPAEWQARGGLLRGSLLWFLAGPAFLGLAAISGSGLPVALFLTAASLWAWWHVLRQHLGFVGLYARVSGETDAGDAAWDRAALYTGMLAPFVAFALGHPQARPMLGLTGTPTWEPVVAAILWGLTAAVSLGWGLRVLSARRAGRASSGPKVAYLALVLAWTAIVLSPPIANRLPIGGITIAVTAWHNVQYHALVWHYKRNRYRTEPAAHGWAAVVGRSFLTYALVGIAFTLAYRLPNCGFGSPPGCATGTTPLFAGLSLPVIGETLFWGFALHHYFVDQYIWRPSRDTRLRADLRLVAAG